MANNDKNQPPAGNGKVARTYTVASGALDSFEDFVVEVNKLARDKGIKNVDRGDVASFLFNKCNSISPEEYFNQPTPKKKNSKG